jgi:hypothetical protein
MNLSRSAAADRGGRGVGQRMVVQPVAGRQRALEERLHPVGTIVDQGEWRHAAWGDAQNLLEQFRPPERQAGAAEHLGQSIDVDLAMVQADQQPEPALPVLDEKVLAAAAGYVAGMPLGRLEVYTGGCSKDWALSSSSRRRGGWTRSATMGGS